MDRRAALRPLDEAVEPIYRLVEHGTPEKLAEAVEAAAAAIEQSLRVALRSDRSATPAEQLRALSPEAMPLDQIIHSLRSRDRISLETAGAVHELGVAAGRARNGETRPDDGQAAERALARLRADLAAGIEVETGAGTGTGTGEAGAVGAAAEAEPVASSPFARPPVATGSGRWMAWVGAVVAVLFLVGLAWVLAGGGDEDYDAGVAAFRAARWDSAAAAFERVLENRPVDVTAMLYLSRAYRRQDRLQEAADVLREAVRVAPDDADVRRELGHLFMALERPGPAAQQYERALELDSAAIPSWAGLIQALRAVDDPRAERLLLDAPPGVQSALRRPDP